jgi:hypothetical protein
MVLVLVYCSIASETNELQITRVKLPNRVGSHVVEPDILDAGNRLRTVGEQVACLSTILTNATIQSVAENRRQASAIRLLGVLADTNSTSLLVTHIAFEDLETKSYPAVYALASIGESAIPKLVRLIENSTNEVVVANSVKSLMLIKGTNYQEFVQGQKTNLPPDRWKRLIRYAVRE